MTAGTAVLIFHMLRVKNLNFFINLFSISQIFILWNRQESGETFNS